MSGRTVWKYPLKRVHKDTFPAPEGAEPLYVAKQFGQLFVWLLVDPEAPVGEITIRTVGTGWDPMDMVAWAHIGSILDDGGGEVWHYFWDRGF
jgi:hypothetical protein